MIQNLSGNGDVLTHCLVPKGPAFSDVTQHNESELEFSSENYDHHCMKGCQCRVAHIAEITFGFVRWTYILVMIIKSHSASQQI